jgi:hypothetical protein
MRVRFRERKRAFIQEVMLMIISASDVSNAISIWLRIALHVCKGEFISTPAASALVELGPNERGNTLA